MVTPVTATVGVGVGLTGTEGPEGAEGTPLDPPLSPPQDAKAVSILLLNHRNCFRYSPRE
ncbi:MAG: hypothetical protein IJR07_00855 [Bacteroidaceae bacterium]|nr:hypothetical protein [Bacteroidaceae bacterium]